MPANHDLDPQSFSAGAHHLDGLRVTCLRDEERVIVLAAFEAMAHGHGFGGRSGLVEQRGIGDFHGGQIDDHGLEIEQRLQPPLGNLGLVGSVLGVPAGVLQNVALNDRRGDAVVITHADEGAKDAVLEGNLAQFIQKAAFAAGSRQVQRLAKADL